MSDPPDGCGGMPSPFPRLRAGPGSFNGLHLKYIFLALDLEILGLGHPHQPVHADLLAILARAYREVLAEGAEQVVGA